MVFIKDEMLDVDDKVICSDGTEYIIKSIYMNPSPKSAKPYVRVLETLTSGSKNVFDFTRKEIESAVENHGGISNIAKPIMRQPYVLY